MRFPSLLVKFSISLKITFCFTQIENEENVLVALRIIIELHKQYRPQMQSEVQGFLLFVKGMYKDLASNAVRGTDSLSYQFFLLMIILMIRLLCFKMINMLLLITISIRMMITIRYTVLKTYAVDFSNCIQNSKLIMIVLITTLRKNDDDRP